MSRRGYFVGLGFFMLCVFTLFIITIPIGVLGFIACMILAFLSPKGSLICKKCGHKPTKEMKTSDAPRGDNNLEDLQKIASLRESGVITEEEFAAKKKQLLGI